MLQPVETLAIETPLETRKLYDFEKPLKARRDRGPPPILTDQIP